MPRPPHTEALGVLSERTGAAAQLGERGARKVAFRGWANSPYVFFLVGGRALARLRGQKRRFTSHLLCDFVAHFVIGGLSNCVGFRMFFFSF